MVVFYVFSHILYLPLGIRKKFPKYISFTMENMNNLPLVPVGGTSSGGPASGALIKHRRSGTAAPVTNGTVVDGNPPDLASLFECPICYDYVLPPSMSSNFASLTVITNFNGPSD